MMANYRFETLQLHAGQEQAGIGDQRRITLPAESVEGVAVSLADTGNDVGLWHRTFLKLSR